MDAQDIRVWLADWENLGPMRSVEDLLRSMEQRALAMGAAAAPLLTETLLSLEREGSSLLDPLLDFLEIYARRFPEELSSALLRKLGPNGPPILVDTLGSTRSPAAVETLRKQLNLEQADENLLVAVAGALGEIGGQEAIRMLHELWQRPALPERVREEVTTAFENLGSSV